MLAVSVLLVLSIALFEYFLPFETLLPAAKIARRQEGELRIHFLDVGQGDMTVVEFPEGDLLVVDAGDGAFEASNKAYRFLKGLSFRSLSIAVTHPDADHCGGVEDILRRMGADRLYLPAVGTEDRFYQSMLEEAERIQCPIGQLTRYSVIAQPCGAYVVCLSPYSQEESSDNDCSTVLYLRYGETCVLLTGDISSARERLLMREYALDNTIFDKGVYSVRLEDVDILKVAHHGSSGSSCEEWLELLDAETAVISCGADNPYGHPHAATVARLTEHVENIYRTDELGDIVVRITPQEYTVATE